MPFDAMAFVVDPDFDVLDARSLFRTMVDGLVAQGVPSYINAGICQYRARKSDGAVLKCAVGFVVTDEEAAEGDEIGDAAHWARTKGARFPDRLRPHIGLLRVVQSVHDNWAVRMDASANTMRSVSTSAVRHAIQRLRGWGDIDQADVDRLEKLVLS